MKKLSGLPAELADRLDIPDDLLLNSAKLTLIAGRRALVENHRGILDYGTECIVINLGRGKLSITGSELSLRAMNSAEVLISGRIRNVEWE